MKQHLAIIIPCYNDIENIPLVVQGLRKAAPQAKIVIVDDSNSQEKKKLQKFVGKQKNIHIIKRKQKNGRGSAVLEGFKKVLLEKNIKYIFEMDADTSHDPRDLIKFLKKKTSADMIIGSRYIQGSKIVNWPKRRLIMSKLINYFLLTSLFHLGIRDYTTGFRMYNRKSAEYLLTIPLYEKGFLLLSETAYRLKQAGFTLYEVPITFTDRKYGKSSVNTKDVFLCLISAFKIRFIYKI